MGKRIIVADDEPDTLDLCYKVLTREGHEVSTVKDGLDAVKIIEKEPFDLLLLDIRMPGKNGLEVLDVATSIGLDTVMITAYASVDTAVDAMKRGARDYLAKPFTAAEIRSVVEKVISRQKLLETDRSIEETQEFYGIVGNSPPMRELYGMIDRIAGTDSNILIEGESGTGKELAAKAIHAKSMRSNKPFIPVNCGALPENLLESELFGHVRGAFTGAVGSKQGLFEAASNGTIFLDEIAETSPNLQVKLLRVLQEKEIRPVGSVEHKKTNVRIVAATNKDLSKEVSSGRFREDLFYRLSVISLRLPPLRERKEDIPPLVHHFIIKFNRLYNREIEGVASQAMQILLDYHWPGNVRELGNVIERAVILEKGKILTSKVLSLKKEGMHRSQAEGTDQYKSLEKMEKDYIEKILSATRGNRTKTAAILGIGRRTLYDKIIAYGIKEE